MSEEQVFEVTDTEVEAPNKPEAKKKVKKPRKPMSEERKAQLREQLAKARLKSAESRKKKALAKKIDKEEKEKELDQKIAKQVLNKNPLEDEISLLKEEIKSLRADKGSNHSEEIKVLKEELNLFKKGLADQIHKAKEIQKQRILEKESKNIILSEDVKADTKNTTTSQNPDPPVVPAPKPRNVLSSRTRGGYKN